MVVLALDTTTPTGSVAVLRGEQTLVERSPSAGVPHGRRLPGDILAALDSVQLTLADVELYAVASGPGAFTGLRIGIATIQGLAFAHGRPVVAVSALEALARAALRHAPPGAPLVGAWMDAARGEIFSALYEVVDDGLQEVEEPSVGSADATLTRWHSMLGGRSVRFVGDGAVRYGAAIRAAAGEAGIVPVTPLIAAEIGRLGLARAAAGLAGPPHAIRPLYVRRPDAELARERRREELPEGA